MDIVEDWFDIEKLISAAETEDEIGTVLRMHLALESILNHFLRSRIPNELVPYIKVPNYMAQKITLAAAFGMPVPFLAAIREVNHIRNSIAHDGGALAQDKVAQLARQVDNLRLINSSSFYPLDRRYIEFPQSQPEKRFAFGTSGARIDFLIATFALIAEMAQWLKIELRLDAV